MHLESHSVYHYHLDLVCLIRDLGGSVVDNSRTVRGTTYTWIQDNGNSASLLLGFILDGLPVYGPAVFW